MLKQFGLYDKLNKAIKIIPPQGYFEMLLLEKNAKAILTDSGVIQKEAYFFKVPCITLRNTTEWIETIKQGWNILVDTDKSKILDAINNFKPDINTHINIYGSGNTAGKIIKIIKIILENQS
jgi:UDP-N-acetylglucosamine 2-epimerase (non-hydrolysing)